MAAFVGLHHGGDVVDHGGKPGDGVLAVADGPDLRAQPPLLAAGQRETLNVMLPVQAGGQMAGDGDAESLALGTVEAAQPALAEQSPG